MDINEADRVFDNIKRAFEKNLDKMIFNAANVGSADLQKRVFNKGQSTDKQTMHYRSAPYKTLRTRAGLQVAVKDLQFTGDMFRSLTLTKQSEHVVVYRFNNVRAAQIAQWQEEAKQVGKDIFTLNQDEIDNIEAVFLADMKRLAAAVQANPNAVPTLAGKQSATQKSIARNRAKRAKFKATASKGKAKTNYEKKIASAEKAKQRVQKLKATGGSKENLAKAKTAYKKAVEKRAIARAVAKRKKR